MNRAVGVFVAIQVALILIGVSASGRSYAVWATAGAAATIMMLMGGFAGISILLLGAFAKDKSALTCAAILLAGCTLPMVLLLAAF